MRRTLIILAFLYFSIDSVFFLAKSGWPFSLPQWILVFMVIGMVSFAIYQWKLMVKEEKEKKQALKEEEERIKQQEAEQDHAVEYIEAASEEEGSIDQADAGSKYDD